MGGKAVSTVAGGVVGGALATKGVMSIAGGASTAVAVS